MPSIEPELFTKLKNLSYALGISGMLVAIIISVIALMGGTNKGSIITLVSSYGAVLTSLIFLSGLVIINMISQGSPKISSIVFTIFPFILVIIILSLLMTILTTNFDKIVVNRMPKAYYSLSLISTIFLTVEIYMLFNAIYNKGSNNSLVMNPVTYSTILLYGTINLITVITLGIMPKFFTVDG